MGKRLKEGRLSVIAMEVKGERNQKYVLTAVSEELVPKTFYKFDIDQPIMCEGKACPLFVRVHEGSMFAPTVRVSEMEECCEHEHHERHEHEDCCDSISVCGEKKRSKEIRVDKYGLGDVAFGSDLVCKRSCGKDCARKDLWLYLNNGGEFTLLARPRFEEE